MKSSAMLFFTEKIRIEMKSNKKQREGSAMNKKLIVCIGGLASMCVFSGCMGPKVNNYGFPTVPGGLLFSEMQNGQIVQKKMLPKYKKFTVVKPVKAEATTTSFVGLVSIGDASYATLKAKALADCREADEIIDLEIDSNHNNILGIVNKVTTVMRGTAIKYQK